MPKKTDLFEFDLRDTVRSISTGNTGFVIGRTQHLDGWFSYYVVPYLDKPESMPIGDWYDGEDLEPIKRNEV